MPLISEARQGQWWAEAAATHFPSAGLFLGDCESVFLCIESLTAGCIHTRVRLGACRMFQTPSRRPRKLLEVKV